VEAEIAPGQYAVDGRVRDVVYLGLYTRYLVELENGGDLVVVQQNLNSTSMDVLSARGQPVRLLWKRDHIRQIAPHNAPQMAADGVSPAG
jgi:hypothetical protein